MNREFSITYRGKNVFDLAMQLAFTSEYDKPLEKQKTGVCGYRVYGTAAMFLFDFKYKHDPATDPDYIALPYKMELKEAIPFVWGWLEKTEPSQPKPDTDGEALKGFRITTDRTDWRGEGNLHGSFIQIQPTWIIYGK